MLLVFAAFAAEPPPPTGLNLTSSYSGCQTDQSSADVTVCGYRDKDRYRIKPQYRESPETDPAKAEFAIGGVRVGTETERVDINGFPSNRVMLRIKIPF